MGQIEKFIVLVICCGSACLSAPRRGLSHLDAASQTKTAARRNCHGILLECVLELDDFLGT